MKHLAIIAAFFVLFTVLAYFAGWQTKARLAEADCVVATAKAQGYVGDYYSQDAWNIFINECK